MSDLYDWVPWRETVCPACHGSGHGASGLVCMVCCNLPPKDVETADMWLRQTQYAKFEKRIDELEEQIAWATDRCNKAMDYGHDGERFRGTINSAVAAVCDTLIAMRGETRDDKRGDNMRYVVWEPGQYGDVGSGSGYNGTETNISVV